MPIPLKEQQFGPILIGSLTCFITGFFFLNLYFSQVSDKSMYIGPSIIFSLIAVFFLLAMLLAHWCKRLFALAHWLNDKYVVVWLLFASMTRAFTGLKNVLDSAGNSGIKSEYIAIVIWFFIIYLLLYFVALLVRLIKSSSKREKPIITRSIEDGTLLVLGITIVLMILKQLTTSEYLTMIGVCIVLLCVTIYRKRKEQSIYVLDALVIILSAAILLQIGESPNAPFWWFWFCLSLIFSAFILLLIDMHHDYHAFRQYLTYDETIAECRELID
jgi:hypothetical protein